MFIPLHDTNTLKHIRLQYVTLLLIVLNVLAWLIFSATNATETASFLPNVSFGFIPSDIFNIAEIPQQYEIVPEPANFLTYSFLHVDFWHLAGNMLFLWVFGDNVEDAMGHLRFLVFYFLCAAAGAMAHGLMDMTSQVPLIGASGAVAGVIAAYLMLHPKVRVWVLVLMRIPLPLPASIVLGLWIGMQVYMFFVDPDSAVSWGAHLGGILAGLMLVIVFKRRSVPLFDQQVELPDAVIVEPEPAPKPIKQKRNWGRD